MRLEKKCVHLRDHISLPNIISVMKYRKFRWAGNIARVGEQKHVTGCKMEHWKERDHLEDLG
jgi:hypothetical protein